MKEEQIYTGLTTEEVEERKKQGQINQTDIKVGKSIPEIIISNTFTYFNAIFAILAALVISAGSYRNLSFLIVVIANTLIGIIQEINAKNVLEKMNLLNAPQSHVYRDGKLITVPSTELVKDDIVVFSAGSQVCADAVVLSGKVSVNESLLTGEQDEIVKQKDSELMSGSFIVSGECVGMLEKVGNESYISKVTKEAKKLDSDKRSEMVKSVDTIVRFAGIVIIPIGIALFYQSFFVRNIPYSLSITSMVAAVIGMIPEGLYLLLTLALATGSIRLARKNVLLHEMRSIEALARVDVLCVDKTGTITEPKMSISEIIPASNDQLEENKEYLNKYVSASTDKNGTMLALKDYFVDYFDKNPNKIVKNVYPFSSATKYGAVEFEDETYILGAPEFVVPDKMDIVNEKITSYTKRGYRVLVFARSEGDFTFGEYKDKREIICYVVLANAIRENAVETFSYFKEQNVTIKVISGDNPLTVSEVAKKAGIENAEYFVDARTLTSDDLINKAAEKYTVFGRVTPLQKKKLVLAMKMAGHTVAMTGDGVNDILAMKSADCSVAMASGSEATAQAAQVVLLDSDFAHMPNVVAEGRRVVNNIQRSATLFIVKNIFSLVLAIISIALAFTYPLDPTQIMLISIFTIGLPGFLLAFESNNNRIEGKFIRNVLLKALPSGLTDAFIVGALSIFCNVIGVENKLVGTTATMLLAVVGFMILRKISMPFSKYRYAVFMFDIVCMILCALFMPEFFNLATLTPLALLLTLVFAFAAESLFRNLTMLINKFNISMLKRLGDTFDTL